MKKNRLFAAITAAALALSLAACGSAPASASTPASTSGSAAGESFKVGIVQYTSHSSLDEICTAIQSELTALSEASVAAGGPAIEFEVQNGQADTATLNDICKLFVSDGVDLIIPPPPPPRPPRCRAPTSPWSTARSPTRSAPSWRRAWRPPART